MYDGNEDEYEEFYDYAALDEEKQLAQADVGYTASGYELMIKDPGSRKVKIIGNRELARYYRMNVRPEDTRGSARAGAVVARYRALQIETKSSTPEQRVMFAQRRRERHDFKTRKWAVTNKGMGNLIRDLPKDCPY